MVEWYAYWVYVYVVHLCQIHGSYLSVDQLSLAAGQWWYFVL